MVDTNGPGPSRSARVVAATIDDRRQSPRLHGPFDGVRIGTLDLPVSIYDVSTGGCFVNAKHAQQPGVRFDLRIQLPGEGWLRFTTETLSHRSEYGYAVRFVEVDAETAARLASAVERLSADPTRIR